MCGRFGVMNENVIEESLANIEEVSNFYTTFALTMDRVPKDGGWTASQCLAHIADAEISLALRLRMMLTSDGYQFANWDEDAFSALKSDRDPKLSVEVFRALRGSNIEILGTLDESAWSRTGVRPNGEQVSVLSYIEMMTKHVRSHIDQAVRAAQG